VLRVAAGRGVIREARLLKVVDERVSVPVPTPCFADEDAGVLAYPLISGRSLLGRSPSPGTAHRLGRFLRELHDIDPAAVDRLVPSEDANPSKWLEDLDGPPELLSLLHATVPLPTRQRVVAHADLGRRTHPRAGQHPHGCHRLVRCRNHRPGAGLRTPVSGLRPPVPRRRAGLLRRPRSRWASLGAHRVLRAMRRAGGPRLRPEERPQPVRPSRRTQLRVAVPTPGALTRNPVGLRPVAVNDRCGRQEGSADQARDVCLGGSLTRGSEKRLHLGRRGQLDHPQVGSIAIKSGFETRPTVDRVTPHPPQERQIESLGASGCLDVSTTFAGRPGDGNTFSRQQQAHLFVHPLTDEPFGGTTLLRPRS